MSEFGSREIRICDQTGAPKSREIEICPEQSAEVPREIKICYSGTDCVQPLPELFLTGSDAPGVGTSYSATGGVQPYRFAMSGGVINSATGVVTAVSTVCNEYGADGAAGTVTVFDACGQSAQIDIRLPVLGASWATISDVRYADTFCCQNTTTGAQQTGTFNQGNLTCQRGRYRYYEAWQYTCIDGSQVLTCEQNICGSPYQRVVNRRITYLWTCP